MRLHDPNAQNSDEAVDLRYAPKKEGDKWFVLATQPV